MRRSQIKHMITQKAETYMKTEKAHDKARVDEKRQNKKKRNEINKTKLREKAEKMQDHTQEE